MTTDWPSLKYNGVVYSADPNNSYTWVTQTTMNNLIDGESTALPATLKDPYWGTSYCIAILPVSSPYYSNVPLSAIAAYSASDIECHICPISYRGYSDPTHTYIEGYSFATEGYNGQLVYSDSSCLTSAALSDIVAGNTIYWKDENNEVQSYTLTAESTSGYSYSYTGATDEEPTAASAKIYRKRGDTLREFKPMQDNPTNGVVLYDSTADELTTSRDLSLNSINVVDRIVVAGISYLNGDVISDKNVSIHGDLIVDGTTYTTQEQSLDTTSDYVVLRQNKSALSNTAKSGLVVSNYSSNKHAAIGVDNEGTWRVSDNASESVTSYNDFSYFNGVYYNGLAQDSTISVIVNGATVARDADELSDCVWYDGHYYYHDNLSWFLLSLVDNKITFDIDSPISDAGLIANLESLAKSNLEYYRSLSVMTVTDSENQPLLTREEESTLSDNDLLMWDSTSTRAVHVPRPTVNGTALKAELDSNGNVTGYSWGSSGGSGVSFIGTQAEYNLAKAIAEGNEGYIPSGSLVIITDADDEYLIGDEQ